MEPPPAERLVQHLFAPSRSKDPRHLDLLHLASGNGKGQGLEEVIVLREFHAVDQQENQG